MTKAIEDKLIKRAKVLMKKGKLHKRKSDTGKDDKDAKSYGTLNKLKSNYGV